MLVLGILVLQAIVLFLMGRTPICACGYVKLLIEAGLAYWIRDNLTLNVLMLVHPFDFIRAWQSAG